MQISGIFGGNFQYLHKPRYVQPTGHIISLISMCICMTRTQLYKKQATQSNKIGESVSFLLNIYLLRWLDRWLVVAGLRKRKQQETAKTALPASKFLPLWLIPTAVESILLYLSILWYTLKKNRPLHGSRPEKDTSAENHLTNQIKPSF